MSVNSKIQVFLDQFNAMPKVPMSEITPKAYREMENSMELPEEDVLVDKVENWILPLDDRDIPVRVYTPVEGQAPYPGLVFYHGSGG